MYRYITEFATYLELNTTKHHTIDAYTHDVYQWATMCMSHGVYDLQHVRQEHIDMFVRSLQQVGITRGTAQRKYAALRHFAQIFALPVYIPHLENTLDICCSNNDAVAIYTRLCQSHDPYARRDGMIIRMMYEYRIPYATIAPLRMHHIQWHNTVSYIHRVHISQTTSRDLAAYIDNARTQIAGTSDILFPYVRHDEPIIMPYRIYLHKLRRYLLQHCADTTHESQQLRHDRALGHSRELQRRYMYFHDRS